MDYSKLAVEFLKSMQHLRKLNPHKNFDSALRGETFVLQYIAYQSEDVLPGEICHEMDVSSARIAQTLNSLERKGYITRQINPADRRRVLVKLTPAGREAADARSRAIVENTSKMLSILGEHDAREYVRITNKLAQICTPEDEAPDK